MKLIETTVRVETETVYESVTKTRRVPEDVETPIEGEEGAFNVVRRYKDETFTENHPVGNREIKVIAAMWRNEQTGETQRETYYPAEHLAYIGERKTPPLVEDFGEDTAEKLIALAGW